MPVIEIIRVIVVLLLIALIVILVTRRLSVPYTLGLVVVGFVISFFIRGVQLTTEVVLFVFLPALLFEGAWSMSLRRLRQQWRTIALLVGPGILITLVIIAVPLHFLSGLDWGSAFLLSAILSPTDPVAVLALFRQMSVNENLSTIIEGESLFNDGIAGVFYQVFLSVVVLSVGNQTGSDGFAAWLNGGQIFLVEAIGGVALGAACGFFVGRFVRFIDDALIETTITVVTAYGVSVLADLLHTSSILAVIVAVLFLGSLGRRYSMSEQTREAVDTFWNIVAFISNGLLFLLVGVQLNPLRFFSTPGGFQLLWTAGIAIVAVLLARALMALFIPRINIPECTKSPWWRVVLFWSGLRGALSLALVLALPLSLPTRDALIFSTYAVVFFTLLVQGFSVRWVIERLPGATPEKSKSL